jgi:hypothetical protein
MPWQIRVELLNPFIPPTCHFTIEDGCHCRRVKYQIDLRAAVQEWYIHNWAKHALDHWEGFDAMSEQILG